MTPEPGFSTAALAVCGLFALCFGGLTYALLVTMKEAMAAYETQQADSTARQFEDLFLFIPPAQITRVTYMLAVTVFMALLAIAGDFSSPGGIAVGFLAGGLGAATSLQAPRLALSYLRERRLKRFNTQLEDALTRMSNSLKAGFSILQAFEAVVKEGENPIAQEFGVFLHQLRVGVRFEDALKEMDRRVGSEDLTLTIRAIEVSRITGGNLTDVLAKISETIRERARIQGKIDSMTAQGRLQGWVVGLIPLFLLVALSYLDPAMIRSFVTSVPGMLCLAGVLVLEVTGFLIIRRIVRIEI